MPVIVFSSPKGGCGKTTAATLLATELAQKGASVTVIDADPNRNVADWSKLPGAPEGLTVISDVTEETIVDQIEAASAKSAFVIVDLEGTANLLVSYAISFADFVVIPMQGSQLDAKQAGRQIRLIRAQERVVGRAIPFAVLFTRTSPAIMPRTQRHIEAALPKAKSRSCRRAYAIAKLIARCFLTAARCPVSTARTSAISTWRSAMPAPSPAKWSNACARRRTWRRWRDDRRRRPSRSPRRHLRFCACTTGKA